MNSLHLFSFGEKNRTNASLPVMLHIPKFEYNVVEQNIDELIVFHQEQDVG
jgi:hypothetical protein